jgi:hypothetical protein
MGAVTVRQGAFITLSALRFGAGAKPAVTFSRWNTLAGRATLAASTRSKRTGPAFRCAATNPVLIGTLVLIFFKAERIE